MSAQDDFRAARVMVRDPFDLPVQLDRPRHTQRLLAAFQRAGIAAPAGVVVFLTPRTTEERWVLGMVQGGRCAGCGHPVLFSPSTVRACLRPENSRRVIACTVCVDPLDALGDDP